MGSGKMRSTRRLRSWMVEQVSSGKYPGLVWDDVAKTMFRIPWKHAGKQDFRSDEDGAIFKAWAEFKGKLTEEGRNDPASWKTRLRCALNKSPEFTEVVERSQLDISEPYKVYRLVPTNEQGVEVPEKKSKPVGRQKRMSSRSDSEDVVQVKQMKEEEIPSQLCVEEVLQANDVTLIHMEEFAPQSVTMQKEGLVDEIQLDVRIEAPGAQDSFHVAIRYLGEEVLKRDVLGSDIRITYLPSFSVPPTRASLVGGFPRIALPEPPSSLPCAELQALSTLLPYMEKGVALTSTRLGIYGTRFCQGRVFWRGPHTATPGPCRMERNTEPVMLFSKEVFKRRLDHFRMNGGEPPQCDITLCFGEELKNMDDPSSKLITAQITLPWAKEQVQQSYGLFQSISFLQSLASQSPHGEITLNLVPVPQGIQCQAP